MLFLNPVNLEWETILSGQLNYAKFEYLNIPDKEVNINIIAEQIFLQEKTKIGHIRIINFDLKNSS